MGKTSDWKLFVISHMLEEFLSQHNILQYLFENILFKFYSIGSEFTKCGDEIDKLFV